MYGNEILLDVEDHVAVITINRPKVMNALSDPATEELIEALDAVENNDDVSVVIVTGMGEKAFCAGHDISTFDDVSELGVRKAERLSHALCNKINYFDKPVIAAVNGYAFGAGCEIAISCDFRIASENARFGLPEVSLGIIPGQGGTQRLARLIGTGPAKYYAITCEHMKSDRAYQLGLVEKVVPVEELLPTCKKIAAKIAANGPCAVRILRNAINHGLDMDLNSALLFEMESFLSVYNTDDRKEGVAAFLEKRKPEFKGR